MNQESTFKQWCIVELFGHQKIAGLCSEQNIAGTNMLRVDVPETKTQPAFSKIYGSAAIYAINPVDEQTCIMTAEGLQVVPIAVWNAESFIVKFNASKPALEAPNTDEIMHVPYEDDDEYLF